MAGIYETFSNFKGTPQMQTEVNNAALALGDAIKNSPGVTFMNDQKPTDFGDLFTKFASFISAGKKYTWQGTSGGAGGYPMLDGPGPTPTASDAPPQQPAKVVGECAMYARALTLLACAPAPYGLGLDMNQFDVVMYQGPNGKGFVSDHSADGVIQLGPNVKDQALYFWNNHKVVSYNGKFYDVMYNKIYDSLADMVKYSVEGDTVPLNNAVYYTTTLTTQAPDPGQTGTWFKEQPTKFFFGPSTTMPF